MGTSRAKLRKSLIFGECPNANIRSLEEQTQEAINKLLYSRVSWGLREHCPDLFRFIERQSLKLDICNPKAINTSYYGYGVRLFEKSEGEEVEICSFSISFRSFELVHLQDIRSLKFTKTFQIVHKEKEYDGESKKERKDFLDAVVDDYIDLKGLK